MYESKEKYQKILTMMKQSRIYWTIKKEVTNSILKNKKDAWHPNIQQIFKNLTNLGHDEQINNLIANCMSKSIKKVPLQKDNIPEIHAMKLKWCQNIIKIFRTVASKLRKDQEDQQQDQSVNYVYDANSYLEFLTTIKLKLVPKVRHLEIYLFPYQIFRIPKFGELKTKFDFIFSNQNITGKERQSSTYRDRQKKARKLIQNQTLSADIQKFLLYGSTNGQRVELYMKYFQIQVSNKQISYLLEQTQKKPNLFDNIVVADISQILNDQRYFVFKQEIRKLLKMFIRDKSILEIIKIRPHLFNDLQIQIFKQEIPVNHILPCKMLSKYIAPFCYISLKIQQIYQIFRVFYCNYFCLLQSISSQNNSILYLCLIFEQLLETTERKMSLHFTTLQIQPLRIVFPWMFYCFIGYIDIQQIFYLFDRIIALNSLQILPLYCMSIIFKQKNQILEAKSIGEIQEILEESLKNDYMVQTIKYYLTYHL